MAGESPRVWVRAGLATGGGRAPSGGRAVVVLRMLGRSCLRIGAALGGASCAGGFVDGSKVTAVVGEFGDRDVRGGNV